MAIKEHTGKDKVSHCYCNFRRCSCRKHKFRQCVHACSCSVLQCVTVCCSVLQYKRRRARHAHVSQQTMTTFGASGPSRP